MGRAAITSCCLSQAVCLGPAYVLLLLAQVHVGYCLLLFMNNDYCRTYCCIRGDRDRGKRKLWWEQPCPRWTAGRADHTGEWSRTSSEWRRSSDGSCETDCCGSSPVRTAGHTNAAQSPPGDLLRKMQSRISYLIYSTQVSRNLTSGFCGGGSKRSQGPRPPFKSLTPLAPNAVSNCTVCARE